MTNLCPSPFRPSSPSPRSPSPWSTERYKPSAPRVCRKTSPWRTCGSRSERCDSPTGRTRCTRLRSGGWRVDEEGTERARGRRSSEPHSTRTAGQEVDEVFFRGIHTVFVDILLASMYMSRLLHFSRAYERSKDSAIMVDGNGEFTRTSERGKAVVDRCVHEIERGQDERKGA